MIQMQEQDRRVPDRKSSKGNQLKFERDGIWYKADYMGYEGLAEFVITQSPSKLSSKNVNLERADIAVRLFFSSSAGHGKINGY